MLARRDTHQCCQLLLQLAFTAFELNDVLFGSRGRKLRFLGLNRQFVAFFHALLSETENSRVALPLIPHQV